MPELQGRAIEHRRSSRFPIAGGDDILTEWLVFTILVPFQGAGFTRLRIVARFLALLGRALAITS
jgi:hypothetical protein